MTEFELAAAVARLLRDASNRECMMHTRLTAAYRALGLCLEAGRGTEADRRKIAKWEARRYSSALHGRLKNSELVGVVARVRILIAEEFSE